MTPTEVLVIIAATVIIFRFGFLKLVLFWADRTIRTPITYANEYEWRSDDPATSKKWLKYRLAVKLRDYRGYAPVTLRFLNGFNPTPEDILDWSEAIARRSRS